MEIPSVSLDDLFTAGCHFGHATQRWNPKMKPYIFGARGGVHIIDLDKSLIAWQHALRAIFDVMASGGRILFVGTKPQSQNELAEAAIRSGQYYVNHRWLGGMLTNWKTIAHSVRRFKDLESKMAGDLTGYTKKERLNMERDLQKLRQNLGGIKDMHKLPDMMICLDTIKEAIAIQEAKVLDIPVVAIVDSNSNPDNVAYPIPGNDDAARSLKLYCDIFARTILAGLEKSIAMAGADIGEKLVVTDGDQTTTETAETAPKSTESDDTKNKKIDGKTAKSKASKKLDKNSDKKTDKAKIKNKK